MVKCVSCYNTHQHVYSADKKTKIRTTSYVETVYQNYLAQMQITGIKYSVTVVNMSEL